MLKRQFTKILLLVFVLMLLPILPLRALAAAPAEAEGLVLSAESLEVGTGRTAKLTFTLPDGAGTPKKTEWTTADNRIATVIGGAVKGVGPGKTAITLKVTLSDDQVLTADCQVEVYRPVVNVSGLANVTVFAGESAEPITVTILPEDAKYRDVTFSSADEKIAKVNEKGVISGISAGKTVVTVTSCDPVEGNAKPKYYVINVTVLQKAESLTLSHKATEIGDTTSGKITATVLPENTSNPNLKWESSNKDVLTVNADGSFTGVSVGTATITVTTLDSSELTATCEVEVYPSVKSVDLTYEYIDMQEGITAGPLELTLLPENAKYPGLKYESSDENIVTVDQDGYVTSHAMGKAVITVTSTEPTTAAPKFDTVNMNIVQFATDVQLSEQKIDVAREKTYKLEAKVLPDNTTDPRVEWTSADPFIASVSHGIVTARNVGTVTITATAQDGSEKFGTCEVTVYQLVTKIEDPYVRPSISMGKTLQLAPQVFPEDARDKSLSWSSDNPRIATVDDKGVVTAVREGKAKITATANDGSGKKLDYTITVEPLISLEAVEFNRIGKDGNYNEFDVKFRNITKTRSVEYFEFVAVADEGTASEKTLETYTETKIGVGSTIKAGPWRMPEIKDAKTVELKLQYVKYADGTEEEFADLPSMGSFNLGE